MMYLGKPGRRHARSRALAPARIIGTAALFTLTAIAFLIGNRDSGPNVEPGNNKVFDLALPAGHGRPAAALSTIAVHPRLPFEPLVPGRLGALSAAPRDSNVWTNVEVAPGDNLSLIFSRLKLSKTDLHEIVSLDRKDGHLRNLRPGQILRIRADGDALASMVLEIDQLNSLWIEKAASGFSLRTEAVEPEIRVAEATTLVSHSLFVDGQKVGLSDALIMHLTDIFGWDIDFALDIHANDQFSVIYEEVYKDGELIKQGRILAAEFVNRGNSHRAALYTGADGTTAYYSEDGRPMRKAFLRTPVNFTRISSKFTLNRRHPILNTIRAHRGVDYAAPMGTPVLATANGSIRGAGNNRGYGLAVELQHGKAYSTLYAHLSRFAKGVRRGASVKQGQVIGYVGKTGLATGPHLHYEFRVNGVHRNPLTVDLPKAEPLDGRLMADFRETAAPLFSRLDILVAQQAKPKHQLLAQIDESPEFAPAAVSKRN